jgi:hypothetical protein
MFSHRQQVTRALLIGAVQLPVKTTEARTVQASTLIGSVSE